MPAGFGAAMTAYDLLSNPNGFPVLAGQWCSHDSFNAVQAGTLLRTEPCPVSVAQGRAWLEKQTLSTTLFPPYQASAGKPLLICRNVSFTYAADAADVLHDCSFSVYSGECFALLGANGSGKSTLLSLLSGQRSPYSGTILLNGRKPADRRQSVSLACLPQDPQLLFSRETVAEELTHAAKRAGLSKEDAERRIRTVCSDCALSDTLLSMHPYEAAVSSSAPLWPCCCSVRRSFYCSTSRQKDLTHRTRRRFVPCLNNLHKTG